MQGESQALQHLSSARVSKIQVFNSLYFGDNAFLIETHLGMYTAGKYKFVKYEPEHRQGFECSRDSVRVVDGLEEVRIARIRGVLTRQG